MSLREQVQDKISLRRANRLLFIAGIFKIRLIGLVRPRIIGLSSDQITIRIPLNFLTKNHLNSMYFGSLAIGADLAAGFMAFYFSRILDIPVQLVFSKVEGTFHKRPDAAVFFICEDGKTILEMLDETRLSNDRVTRPIHVKAYLSESLDEPPVASFVLGLSLKKIHKVV